MLKFLTILKVGLKAIARNKMQEAGLPLLPGTVDNLRRHLFRSVQPGLELRAAPGPAEVVSLPVHLERERRAPVDRHPADRVACAAAQR